MGQRIIFSIFLTIFLSLQDKTLARFPLKIVNGTTAKEGEFPYLVQLRDKDGAFHCGGGIIGSEWILTAGHCVDGEDIDSIVYGTNKLYDYVDGNPNTSIKVKNVFQHPNFTYYKGDIPIYDIALLQLEEPITFDEKAQPIKLAEANETVPFHKQGVVAGWGVNWTWGELAPYLQKINLTLLTDQECIEKIDDFLGLDAFNPTHNFCSNDYYNGECYGDSGSPYVIDGLAYGTVSWSYKPCGTFPGTYSRITNPEYRIWIKDTTNI